MRVSPNTPSRAARDSSLLRTPIATIMREVGVSKGKKTSSTSAPPAGRGQLRRDRAGARAEGARACRKSLAPALAPARKSLRGRAQGGRPRASGRGGRASARAPAPAARGRRVCASSVSPHRSGSQLLHTAAHTAQPPPAFPSFARDPTSVGPASLPPSPLFGESLSRPEPVRWERGRTRVPEARAGERARPFTFAPERVGQARASGATGLSPAGAARAPDEGRCHGGPANHLGAWQRPAAPARPAPSCQTVTLSVTVRSNDIRILKQLVIRGVISCN